MKKITTFLLAAAMLLALVACSGDKGVPDTGDNRPATDPPTTTTTDDNTTPDTSEEFEQSAEPSQPFEPPEQHDYTPGTEHTMSRHVNPRDGAFISDHRPSPIVAQDKMIYFVNRSGMLCKMPINGTADDVWAIYDLGKRIPEADEIQIVGDYVYIRYDYSSQSVEHCFKDYTMAIARIKTDGSEAKTLVKDMMKNFDSIYLDVGFNTFVVRGDELYYTSRSYTQQSATAFSFTTYLKCYNMATGETRNLGEFAVSDADKCMAIEAYTENTLLLKDYETSRIKLYDYETGLIEEAPESMQRFFKTGFYVDGGSYYCYSQSSSHCKLYRFSPENGYECEEYYSAKYSYSHGEPSWHVILYKGGALYISTSNGMTVIADGERREINSDSAAVLFDLGDEYIYYKCYNKFYRVLPDGTGWEELNW